MEADEQVKKSQIDYLFEFVNFDMSLLDFDNLHLVAMPYIQFAYLNDPVQSKNKYALLTKPAFDKTADELKNIKIFLLELQSHLRDVLDKIIGKSDLELFIEQKGIRIVKIIDNEFIEEFYPKGSDTKKLILNSEKDVSKSILINIIMNSHLMPSQFNNCDQCGNYFYQKTKRPMKFCSIKCSNLNRQNKYQMRQGIAVTEAALSKEEMKNIAKATRNWKRTK